MVPRSLMMFGVMFASLLAISPAFADDDDVRFSLSGTVWLDANVDGVRQSFEPAVPRALVILWRGNKPYGDQKDTDDGGKYRFDWPTEGWSDDERHIDMLVLYKRPWDDYVDEYPGSTFSYSHWGCAYLHVQQARASERWTYGWYAAVRQTKLDTPSQELAGRGRAFLQGNGFPQWLRLWLFGNKC